MLKDDPYDLDKSGRLDRTMDSSGRGSMYAKRVSQSEFDESFRGDKLNETMGTFHGHYDPMADSQSDMDASEYSEDPEQALETFKDTDSKSRRKQRKPKVTKQAQSKSCSDSCCVVF